MFDEIQTAAPQPASAPAPEPIPQPPANPLPAAPQPGAAAHDAEEAQPGANEPPLPKGVQKRIDRLTRERYRLQAELDASRRQPAQPAAQAPTASDAPAGMPQRAQFKNDDEFFDAVVDWRAEHKVAERTRKEQQAAEEADRHRLQTEWEKKVDAASEAYEDFEEVALAQDVPVTPTMAQAIKRSEKGADIAYYLGKNKAEAAKIARMDTFSQAMAIGRIEATVSRPAEKLATGAPAPISPVGSRSAAPTKDPEKMTTSEWMKQRNAEIAAQRKKR